MFTRFGQISKYGVYCEPGFQLSEKEVKNK